MSDYPSEYDLAKLKQWAPIVPEADKDKPCKAEPWYEFFAFIESIWWAADWGFRREGDTYYLSTGGWSGNEDIIGALRENWIFWSLWWQSSRRGGHYVFRHMNAPDPEEKL